MWWWLTGHWNPQRVRPARQSRRTERELFSEPKSCFSEASNGRKWLPTSQITGAQTQIRGDSGLMGLNWGGVFSVPSIRPWGPQDQIQGETSNKMVRGHCPLPTGSLQYLKQSLKMDQKREDYNHTHTYETVREIWRYLGISFQVC